MQIATINERLKKDLAPYAPALIRVTTESEVFVGLFESLETANYFIDLHNAKFEAEQAIKAQPTSTGIPADPHAQIKEKYAELELIYAEPWRLVESFPSTDINHRGRSWFGIKASPLWCEEGHYRIRPAVPIIINGITVPEPVRNRLKTWIEYFSPCPTNDGDILFHSRWCDSRIDNLLLERGLIHLNPEAAAEHGEAMIAPSRVDSPVSVSLTHIDDSSPETTASQWHLDNVKKYGN